VIDGKAMVTPLIVVVTGASGVGKTALVKALEARRLPDIGCYYFDSIGVPDSAEMTREFGSPGGWQVAMTRRWIERLAANPDGVAVAVLDGQTRPAVVAEALRDIGSGSGRSILVDCNADVREARLRGPRGQPELATARMDSWAAYLRGQADALGLRVIDTTSLTPEEGAEELLRVLGIGSADGFSALAYAAEPISFPPLEVVDLAAIGKGIHEEYRNVVINRVNDHCLRLAVFDGLYPWHHHPDSDELFLVIDGCLVIELADGRQLRLLPWQAATVPAGVIHRTRTEGSTVNLCFEKLAADTIFVEPHAQP
jgi:mannose-6-phosphate isomerase-like protein (cupin superfamily)